MDNNRMEALIDRIEQAAYRLYTEDSFDAEAAAAAIDELSVRDIAMFRAAVRILIRTLNAKMLVRQELKS